MHKASYTALLAALAAALLAGPAAAEIKPSGNDKLDKQLKSFLDSQLLEVRCDVPGITPLVVNLRRGSAPNPDQVIKVFLGGKDTLLGSEAIISPIWGKGQRSKSGTTIKVLVDREVQQDGAGGRRESSVKVDLQNMDKLEVVPAFLDIYRQGFLYTNNIPHKAVYATDVKKVSELKADVTYRNLYSREDGREAALKMLQDTIGEPKVAKGFRLRTDDLIQTFGERLYACRMQPEYLTTYPVFEWVGEGEKRQYKQTGTKPVAIKVNDVYVHVMLDGDKLLCGMEYFWDNGLSAEGSPKPAINAADAILASRGWMVKHFNKNPPQITVKQITLGFVQDRKDVTLLVPAWIFGASYSAEDEGGEAGLGGNVVQVPCPFAVNALTGEAFDL